MFRISKRRGRPTTQRPVRIKMAHIGYCPNCRRKTPQEFVDSNRSGDIFQCRECNHWLFDDGERVIDNGRPEPKV
jgi:hypothetical protein